MANLQIKGMDDALYEELKRLAAAESRSLSQEVLVLVKRHLARRGHLRLSGTPAEVLLELAGTWVDDRSAEEIASDLRKSRRNRPHRRDRL